MSKKKVIVVTAVFGMVFIIVGGIVAFAGGNKLTDKGQEQLDVYINELVDGSVEYEIQSVYKISGKPSDDGGFTGDVSYTGDANAVSGCPDIQSGDTLWCVVVDEAISTASGEAATHFTVKRSGFLWEVQEYNPEDGREVFEYVGCPNGDAWAVAD